MVLDYGSIVSISAIPLVAIILLGLELILQIHLNLPQQFL